MDDTLIQSEELLKSTIDDIVNIEIDQNTIAIVDTVNKVLLAQKAS